jgi:predicted Zn-dependent protease
MFERRALSTGDETGRSGVCICDRVRAGLSALAGSSSCKERARRRSNKMRRFHGDESGQSAIEIFAAMAALVVALAAAFGIYSFVTRGHGASASKHPLPPLHEFTAAQQEEVHKIRDETAAVREVSVNAATHEGTLTRDEYRNWIGESYSDVTPHERQQLQALNIAFRLLHMMGPGDDLLGSVTRQQSEDIIGFYQFKQNELAVIGDGSNLTSADDFTLSHEYTHSFQAGPLDAARAQSLADKEKDGDPTEYGTTVSCVEEGDATLASVLWAQKIFGADWAQKVSGPTPAAGESATAATSVPPALDRYFNFDYDQCPSFVAAIYRARGWSGVDNLYGNPPTTTEQILHPEKYVNREQPTAMTPIDLANRLGKGWTKQTLSLFGEFDLYNYLFSVLGDEQVATQAAAGWGTGWIGVYARNTSDKTSNGDVLVHIALDWDTERDVREFGAAYGALINKIAPGQGAGGGATCWSLPGEYGYFSWDAATHRTDIVIANNEGALKTAASSPLSTPWLPCPGWAGTAQVPAATVESAPVGSATPEDAAGIVPNFAPACVLAKPGNVIDLVGLGDAPPSLLERLQASFRAEYGLTLDILPALPVGQDALDQSRQQLIGDRLLGTVSGRAARNQPDDVVIGITQGDMMLQGEPDWAFAFSTRDASTHAGVISIARMDPRNVGLGPDDELLFARVEKMVAKSIGVLYLNRPLVPDPHSLMYNNVLSVADLDAIGDNLCLAR